MQVYYFKSGMKHGYKARTLTDAINRKLALRKQSGKELHGAGHFHYIDENGERQWL